MIQSTLWNIRVEIKISVLLLAILGVYNGVQLRWDTYLRAKIFAWFYPPSQRISGTNDTLFESPNIGPGKCAFYYTNHHNSGTFSELPDSTVRNFEINWGKKELYTSKESPITCQLKDFLKLEESLAWEASHKF